jgi:formylglycine-generating enzyme required for sulfatase activity
MRLMSLLVPIAVVVVACSGSQGGGSVAPSTAPTEAAPAPTPVPTLGATRTDAAGVSQVWVPAGTFLMGTDAAAIAELEAADPAPPAWVASEFPSEQPAHEVTLTSGYWIDTTEVTNAAFDAFAAAGGYTTEAYWSAEGWEWMSDLDPNGFPRRCDDDAPDVPRRCLTWYEAEAYATWRGGALPTEAQWEFAARGPESTVYPWGDDWDPARANVVDSTAAVAVGSFPTGASWVGALDMSGNAMEWVADWLAPHADGAVTDPTGPATGKKKVEKGGWWGSNEFVARSAYRHFEDAPTYQDDHIGFRVVSP